MRALRRHHRERVIKKRRARLFAKNYQDEWVLSAHLADHGMEQLCSCEMCKLDPYGVMRTKERREGRAEIQRQMEDS